MRDRRYPIHGAPGVAWVMVFDCKAAARVVEEVRTGTKGRVSFELAAFEVSEAGKPIVRPIADAVTQAAMDV